MRLEGRKQKVLIVHNYYQIPGGEDTAVANVKVDDCAGNHWEKRWVAA